MYRPFFQVFQLIATTLELGDNDKQVIGLEGFFLNFKQVIIYVSFF